MDTGLLLAIDQGTTSSRAIVFNFQGDIKSLAQQEFPQLYPNNGWVEHAPDTIWASTLQVTRQALHDAQSKGGKVAAIGISNQRETSIIWDRENGKPIYNAIVWQDRRTSDICQHLKQHNMESAVQARSGLLLDPYFSATKIAWILDHVSGARKRAAAGKLAFGTIDSYLIWQLSGGHMHATDITNASRTNLFNIHQQAWDDELLKLFNVPKSILPKVLQCADDFGYTDKSLFGERIPILGVAGDQQAAAIGQCCFTPGSIKSTYGTGCFVLINTGETAVLSKNRMLTTIAYQINNKLHYALEGSIFVAGACVQWLRDGLGIIQNAAQTESLAASIDSNNGVYLVPAFTGLGAPYWDAQARAAIFGLSRASGPAELARAALESIAYQTKNLLNAMQEDGVQAKLIKVDGGMVDNHWLLQFLADIISIPVWRPQVKETTALGAAYLAGLRLGLYKSTDDLSRQWRCDKVFTPQMLPQNRERLYSGWLQAVAKVLTRG